MMKNIAVIGMAVLLVGGVASADVVDGNYLGTRYQLEITKEAGVGSVESLDRYTFQVQDQGSGMPINALEVNVSGAGVHHEQFNPGGLGSADTPTPKPYSGLVSPIDTLALLEWSDLDGSELTEPLVDPNTSNEPVSGTFAGAQAEWTGYGSPLAGTVVNLSSGIATPVDVLQVVAKSGTVFDYYVRVSNEVGEGEAFEGQIPEPATLGLLCLGGLALIRRRR